MRDILRTGPRGLSLDLSRVAAIASIYSVESLHRQSGRGSSVRSVPLQCGSRSPAEPNARGSGDLHQPFRHASFLSYITPLGSSIEDTFALTSKHPVFGQLLTGSRNYLLVFGPQFMYIQRKVCEKCYVLFKTIYFLIFVSYLEHQHKQQQSAGNCVQLRLSGQRVEVCEVIVRMLQVQRPQLCGHSAATQVEPTHRCCQSQFTDAQSSPG